ncbi:MAG TPA: molybdopterin-guanine dinucleotide biosynthesis protein MobB [Thermoanaerobaculia bacterium]|nr:molybdopterin-guanine dinucleotide biosynthesis protein MobB [Thermoanaerobaculia bacterium]
MRVVALIGHSGSGKTTAIVALTSYFVARGKKIGAIKHTHHVLNEDVHRGDTARIRRAGADPVILAGNGGEAVVFSSSGTRRIQYSEPPDLLAQVPADIVFVEGFKGYEGWPRIELTVDERHSTAELVEILGRIWPA